MYIADIVNDNKIYMHCLWVPKLVDILGDDSSPQNLACVSET